VTFPDERSFSKMRDKLEATEGILMLDDEASELERFRFKICQELLKYSYAQGYKDNEMVDFLELTKADMSRIFNHC
jgi:hypothetical protein